MTDPSSDSLPTSATAASQANAPGGVLTRRAPTTPFQVHLGEVFEGPFDLLLGMISKSKLDVTEISLSAVTDEFIAHIRAAREQATSWDLSQATEFLLIAATLLEIKAARLIPNLVAASPEDFELIEARDLLFARLLQFRAFKDTAGYFAERMETEGRLIARQAGLEERFSGLLPELVMTATPEHLAVIAARALAPKAPPTVAVDHLHAAQVSVREQARILTTKLRHGKPLAFADLVRDAESTLVVVGRFLALLELFKEQAVSFEQEEHLGPLMVRWVAADGARILVSDEFDSPAPPHSGENETTPAATDNTPKEER